MYPKEHVLLQPGRAQTLFFAKVERLLVTSLAVEGFSLPNALHHRRSPQNLGLFIQV